jgi:formate dehydrogenase iron-sulfur subunit
MKESSPWGARLSRRQFFRVSVPCVAAAALAIMEVNPTKASTETTGETGAVPAMLIDVSRCVGCGNCQRACGTANDLPACSDRYAGLNSDTYTYVNACTLSSGDTRFVKRACMHCLTPGCAAACPVGALYKTPEGPVVADTSKCIGCRYCQYACPFEVPKFEWANTLGVMRKCTSCYERLGEGEEPACSAACPSGAIMFGRRDQLLRSAHARINAQHDHYVPRVYGEVEAGGTARLYISDVAFEDLNLPVLDDMPVPHYAEQVVTRTPAIAAGVALFSTAAYTFLRRREERLEAVGVSGEEKHS